jgi:glyoxylase-like metal-dependent hydrolase (beta-lactamase superfamily II)
MAQESDIEFNLYASGFCEAHTKIVNPINGVGKSRFYAVWALFHIPDIGYIMFDSGYSEAFQAATQNFPDRFYRWATPVTLDKKQTAKALLHEKGIDAKEIRYIIISHFHADHIAGLVDFPEAQFICSKDAYKEALKLSGIRAVSKGILNSLIPDDFHKRVLFIEEIADKNGLNEFGLTEYTFLGIKKFKLILLPGHAKGMLGFLFNNAEKHILYASDASWDFDCFRRDILPSKVVKLFFDFWPDYINTLKKLKVILESVNPPIIIFTHCPKTLDFISNEI